METTSEKQGRILLVDDESAILRTFRYCLEDEGYSVATASSAPQAEALLQRQVFDLSAARARVSIGAPKRRAMLWAVTKPISRMATPTRPSRPATR